MSRSLMAAVVLAAGLSAGASHAQDLAVTGSLQASWTSPQRISPSPDAVLRPGHAVTITVSGKVDVNQERKSERRCGFLGLSCKRVSWTEHHWVSAGQVPVVVQIRPLGSMEPVQTVTVGGSPTTVALPIAGGQFAREYEVVALLMGAGSSIDPARSAGAYTVQLDIDASSRATGLRSWLSGSRPAATAATGPAALDQALLAGHGEAAAKALRDYASSTFPVPGPEANRASHEKLVRKAVDIAPSDPANTIALARYFRAVGLNTLADNALKAAITALESKTDSRSQRMLGEAYLARAEAALAQGGAVDPASSQAAAAFLDQAIKSFRQSGRRDFEAEALAMRGRLVRGLRTERALEEAARNFKAALDLTPDALRGRTAAESPYGGGFAALNWSLAYSLRELTGADAGFPRIEGRVPVAWDRDRKRLLEVSPGGLYWRGLDGETVEAGPFDIRGALSHASGALLVKTAQETAVFTSRNGVATTLTLPCAQPAAAGPIPPPPVNAVGVGPGADLIGSLCGESLRLYRVTGDTPTVQLDKRISTAGGFGDRVQLAVGPQSCGALVARVAGYMPATSITLVKPSGTELRLTLPPGPGGGLGGPTSLAFGFTPDSRVLVAAGAGGLHAFSCADGSLKDSIPLPPPERPNPFAFEPPVARDIAWLDDRQFALTDLANRRVLIVDYPTRQVTTYPFPADVDDFDAQMLWRWIVPAAQPGGAPRYVRFERSMEARRQETTSTFVLPNNLFGGLQLLQGERYLLSGGGGIEPIVTDLATGADVTPAMQGLAGARAIPGPDLWAAIRLEGPAPAVEVYRGATLASRTSLPASAAAAHPATVAAIDALLARLPPGFNPPPDSISFPIQELAALKADASRLGYAYSLRDSLAPLTGGLPYGGHLLCGEVRGRTSGGEMRRLPVAAPSQLLLVTYEDGVPAITPVPGVTDCNPAEFVSGPKPAVLLAQDINGSLSFRWFREGGWVAAGAAPHRGQMEWAMGAPNGDLVILLGNAPGQGAYALKRLPAAGGMVDACAGCASLPLQAAVDQLSDGSVADLQKALDAVRRFREGPLSALLIDRDATLMARPDQDDLVVQALATGKELLRVRLGHPVILEPGLVVVDTGEGRLEVHRLPPP